MGMLMASSPMDVRECLMITTFKSRLTAYATVTQILLATSSASAMLLPVALDRALTINSFKHRCRNEDYRIEYGDRTQSMHRLLYQVTLTLFEKYR